MAEVSSEPDELNLIQYYGDDYDYTGLHWKSLESLGEGHYNDFASSVYEEEEGDFNWSENGQSEQAFDGQGNWWQLLDAYFGGYSREDSRGYGALEYNREDLQEIEEDVGGYYGYDDEFDNQAPYDDYGLGFGDGGEEYGYSHGKIVGQPEYGTSLAEMRLCQSIFGYWPSMPWHGQQECYVEQRLA